MITQNPLDTAYDNPHHAWQYSRPQTRRGMVEKVENLATSEAQVEPELRQDIVLVQVKAPEVYARAEKDLLPKVSIPTV